jgi:arginine decarboxylase
MKDISRYHVVIVCDNAVKNSDVLSLLITRLEKELESADCCVTRLSDYREANPVISNDMDIDAILISTDMELDHDKAVEAEQLIECASKSLPDVPVFLLADRAETSNAISEELMCRSHEYIWIFEDSPLFIAGRIVAAIRHYRSNLMPPLMKAVWEYNENRHEYSWAAPGHQGGRGFTKSPAGKKFYDFYDENLFRTDTGIERTSIGSLLDHTGAFEESEKFASETFGADRSYSVVVGTSGSNRTIMQACLAPDDIAICDRNCHKSIEQGLILSGAIPVYMQPTRNRYGIIGPVPGSEMSARSIREKIDALPFSRHGNERAYAVLTNCTYDGLCCHAEKAEHELAASSDRIHFDEAWYAYARFNPIYRHRFAMRGNPADRPKDAPTVFATHSTHKLLAALSQASYIHVRNGRNKIDFSRMNQAYMMHSTTSPLYAICVSNDVAAKMMAEKGRAITSEVIAEAVDFRQALAKLERDFSSRNSWFFTVWNAPKVRLPGSGNICDFADAPRKLLINDPEPWLLKKGEVWHGFDKIEDDWAMIDPVKVSILTPGVNDDGSLKDDGVPAQLAASWLFMRGIVPTRSTDFQLMFLFSLGITKGKWMTLLNSLLEFKHAYDSNTPIREVLPHLAQQYPERYGSIGLRDLGNQMFRYIKKYNPTSKLNAAFEKLPEIRMTPRDAYMKIVRDEVELVPADQLYGRIAANSVIPYPPGIPMVMSGEMFDKENSPQVEYLKQLSEWDRNFPGFEHDTEGTITIDNTCCVMCVK